MVERIDNRQLRLKETAARMMRWPFMRHLMVAGLHVIIPRVRVGVAAVVLDGAGRILMLRHVFHPLAPWGLPGGWLGRGESPADGALRELREETGLSAVLGPVIHMTNEGRPRHLGISYLAWAEPGPFRLSGEIIEAGWFTTDTLPQPMYAFVYDSIEAAMKQNEQLLVRSNDFSRQTAEAVTTNQETAEAVTTNQNGSGEYRL